MEGTLLWVELSMEDLRADFCERDACMESRLFIGRYAALLSGRLTAGLGHVADGDPGAED